MWHLADGRQCGLSTAAMVLDQVTRGERGIMCGRLDRLMSRTFLQAGSVQMASMTGSDTVFLAVFST